MRVGQRWAPAAVVIFLVVHATPAWADWMVAGYFGAAHTMDAPLMVQQPSLNTDLVFDPVTYQGQSFTGPLYYGYRIGHTLPFWRHVAIEGEYIHLKMYAETRGDVRVRGRRGGMTVDQTVPLQDIVQRFSISHGVNLILVNAVFRYPVEVTERSIPLTLTARLGAGPTIPHAESTIAGATQEGYELGALAAAAAAGAELRLWHGVHALAEYKFTRTNETVSVANGQATTRVRTHHAVFGLGFRF
jgi:hypothetical protein